MDEKDGTDKEHGAQEEGRPARRDALVPFVKDHGRGQDQEDHAAEVAAVVQRPDRAHGGSGGKDTEHIDARSRSLAPVSLEHAETQQDEGHKARPEIEQKDDVAEQEIDEPSRRQGRALRTHTDEVPRSKPEEQRTCEGCEEAGQGKTGDPAKSVAAEPEIPQQDNDEADRHILVGPAAQKPAQHCNEPVTHGVFWQRASRGNAAVQRQQCQGRQIGPEIIGGPAEPEDILAKGREKGEERKIEE